MLVLPVKFPGYQDIVFVILGPDNLERMKHGDPAEVNLAQVAKTMGASLKAPQVFVCFEEPSAALMKLLKGNDYPAIRQYLFRGWEYRPDLGDHDRGPEPLAEPPRTGDSHAED